MGSRPWSSESGRIAVWGVPVLRGMRSESGLPSGMRLLTGGLLSGKGLVTERGSPPILAVTV
ncbi:hypothetical protein GCM10027018_23930 [Paenibacillus thermoaerophilus]